MGGQNPPGLRRAQTGKDGARDSHAQTLADYAHRCQKTAANAAPLRGNSAHDSAVVGGLEEANPNAGDDQPPDNIENRCVGIQRGEQPEAKG